ncbi:peptidase dimerization domain-containing protein [Novosphingobium sp. MW5]|nr:peptidase dimerization domain-containing protein [Novosphingobium sp. MW5]
MPDSCRMVIDRRFLLEENIEEVQSEFMDILKTVQGQSGKASAMIYASCTGCCRP